MITSANLLRNIDLIIIALWRFDNIKLLYFALIYQWRKWGDVLGATAPLSKEKVSFLDEYKDQFILFVLPYFNICPAMEC